MLEKCPKIGVRSSQRVNLDYQKENTKKYIKPQKPRVNKVFVRMFLRFRIMRYGTGYAIPHFLSRE